MNPIVVFHGNKIIAASDFDDSVIGRFWNKVGIKSQKECWLWNGNLNKKGYGSFSPGIKYRSITGTKAAHRFAFLFHYGELDSSLMICHSCDNPGCCNPYHLWQGTAEQNSKDMVSKGRSPRGEKQGNSYLTKTDILAIRAMNNTGRFQQIEIARKFQTSKGNIQHICANDTWRHVA